MRSPPIAIVVGLVVAIAAAPSSADIVIFSYSGEVDSPDFPAGTMFNGTVTYDTTIGLDALPVDATIGVYPDSITAFTIIIGGTDYSFAADPTDEATVKDGFPGGDNGELVDGFEFFLEGGGNELDFLLRDDDADVFGSDALPVSIPLVDEFEFQSFDFALFATEGTFTGSGDIFEIGITVETIPAPSATLLGGLGLATIAALRRRLS